MVLLVVISGGIWAVDALFFARRRGAVEGAGEAKLPLVVDYARSFFPIFLIVLLLRAFLVEPFRIPSGSMIPTLLIGDFILVNKYTYGIRLPVINKKIVEVNEPSRGDVVVFRYPEDPSTPFIKRVIGVPGDRISYTGDKRVAVNGSPLAYQSQGTYVGIRSAASQTGAKLWSETIENIEHQIITNHRGLAYGNEYLVPEGHYFVLGDNRDNSKDSRYWGFVPDENLIGKAFMIWMNWDSGPGFGRIGTKIH